LKKKKKISLVSGLETNIVSSPTKKSLGTYFAPKKKKERNEPITIWNTNIVIEPTCLGTNFKIYNGKVFSNITISEPMFGHKFGEFIFTRKKGTKKKVKKKEIIISFVYQCVIHLLLYQQVNELLISTIMILEIALDS